MQFHSMSIPMNSCPQSLQTYFPTYLTIISYFSVIFSYPIHGVICDGNHGPDRNESYSRNLRCLRDVWIPEEVKPFFHQD